VGKSLFEFNRQPGGGSNRCSHQTFHIRHYPSNPASYRIAAGAVIFLVLLFFEPVLGKARGVTFDAIAGSGAVVAAGQTDVMLLKVRITADEAVSISGITVTYTGTLAGDISSVKLYRTATAGWVEAVNQPALASGGLTSGRVSLAGFSLSLDTGAVTYLVVKADIATQVSDGDSVRGEIRGDGDIAASGVVSGSFPARSIDSANASRINVAAASLSVASWPASLTAGQTYSFTVSCIDAFGNIDHDRSGGTLSICGTPGYEPGTSAAGNAPVYSGNGLWSAGECGQRTCSCRLYKIESGRRIRVRDSALGTVDSPALSVVSGTSGAGAIALAGIDNQTAGVPFTVTLNITDSYGNAESGYAGSVTTLSSEIGVTDSPGGYRPVLPSYTWRGNESSGRATITVITYNRYNGAKLTASDPVLGSVVSNAFDVAGADAAAYTVSGPSSVKLRTKTVFTAVAADTWGNTLDDYSGTARISCSDTAAQCQPETSFTRGSASFTVLFSTWGSQTISLKETGGYGAKGNMSVAVDQPPSPSKFCLSVPYRVTGGTAFNALISAVDDSGAIIPEYNRAVRLSVQNPTGISPSSVYLTGGLWNGNILITGETLETGITLSDGEVITANAATVKVDVADYTRARAYPTVFTPCDGVVRIRYYLRQDSDVNIRIYNAAMDMVREMSFHSGGSGGRTGLNVAEWDGKGGSDGAIGHSGGYHILIDKGYAREWTGAVIKNY